MAWQPDYCTTAELKSYLKIDDTDDDTELALAVTAASRAIDHATNRQFGATASTEERVFESCWSRRRGLYIAHVDDIMTTTGLVVDVSGSATTNYVLEPRNADKESRPWTRIATSSVTSPSLGSGPETIEVTATFGWTSVPDTIKKACLLQASRLFVRRDAPFGVAGSPDIGSELRLLAKVDPDVEVMIRQYRRNHPLL